MKAAYEGKPTIPGFYLRCGLWWTRVTPVHEYFTREGEKRAAYYYASSCDPDKATRYNTYEAALAGKHSVERTRLDASHDIVEVLPNSSTRLWTSNTPPSPNIDMSLGPKLLGELMEHYGE